MIRRACPPSRAETVRSCKVEPPGEVALVHIPDVVPEQGYGQRVPVDLADGLLELALRGLILSSFCPRLDQ